MSSNKPTFDTPPQGSYRDDPDFAETASMSSAVLLDDIEAFPDEELPPYEDNPVTTPRVQEPQRSPDTSHTPTGDSDYIGRT
jgi:hypothetical protein